MRYISASGMHFSATEQQSSRTAVIFSLRYCSILFFYCSIVLLLYCSKSYAEVIDKVVAYVDDSAITLSEFQESYLKIKETVEGITGEDVLNSMINNLLLVKEAKKMRLEAPTDEDLLQDYIDIKIKSRIFIKEEEIQKFYNEHFDEFKGRDYLTVRDEIERYLFELETNKQLKMHLDELRANTEIRIQLN